MSSYIYVIAAKEEGPSKVGFSNNPERRLRQLQTGYPEPLAIYHTEEVDPSWVQIMEGVIHRENRHKRLTGEWFRMSVEDAILEIRHAMIRFGTEVETKAQYRKKS
jgi:predicted GIY-YIG superfamily endonuclease